MWWSRVIVYFLIYNKSVFKAYHNVHITNVIYVQSILEALAQSMWATRSEQEVGARGGSVWEGNSVWEGGAAGQRVAGKGMIM